MITIFHPPVGVLLHWPAWLVMWGMSVGIFAGIKVLSWRAGLRGWAGLGYALLWPGLDPGPFMGERGMGRIDWRGVGMAVGKIGLGAWLLWGVARWCPAGMVAGWVGMVGLIFVLHFGLFHLLAVGWQAVGRGVEPLMNWPVAARSLADFWGRRWNRAFRDAALRVVVRPVARRCGVRVALLAAFVVSAVLHEAVISLPAGGGWGLPTLYFLIQGAGLMVERRPRMAAAFRTRPWLGRGWTLAVAAGPAFWLFHPLFIHRVMIPFFQTIGALP